MNVPIVASYTGEAYAYLSV